MKIHIVVNVKTKNILSIKVTDDEHVHDSKVLPKLINDIIKLDKKITMGELLLTEPMKVMIFLDIYLTMEFCHTSK